VRYDTIAAPSNAIVTLFKIISRSVQSAIFRTQKRYNIEHFPSMRDKKLVLLLCTILIAEDGLNEAEMSGTL